VVETSTPSASQRMLEDFEKFVDKSYGKPLGNTKYSGLLGIRYCSYWQIKKGDRPLTRHIRAHIKTFMLLSAENVNKRIEAESDDL
jgi:hypothetical protein